MTYLRHSAVPIFPSRTHLAQDILGLGESRFGESIRIVENEIENLYHNKTILIIGAGSFIGLETIKLIIKVKPRKILLVDISENLLTHVVREIRGNVDGIHVLLETILLDASTNLLEHVFLTHKIDVILNFAAVKHVRSEGNSFGLLRMLEVNIGIPLNVARLASKYSPNSRIFVVSTDKAADPVNFMGASKRVMEIALKKQFPNFTSVRFANVAFSSGSLLESWLDKLSETKPLVVPEDTYRFFVTPEESGQICLVTSIAPQASVYVPSHSGLTPILMEEFLVKFLKELGLKAVKCKDIDDAFQSMKSGITQLLQKEYPYFCSPLDTQGEKTQEVFVSNSEEQEPWIVNFDRIRHSASEEFVIEEYNEVIKQIKFDTSYDKPRINSFFRSFVPDFHNIEYAETLDGRY